MLACQNMLSVRTEIETLEPDTMPPYRKKSGIQPLFTLREMPQLGSHKSRHGCTRCKQRRVKCDERVPCSSCVRRRETCSFIEPNPSGNSETTKDLELPPDSEDWILDMELMHHYTSVLSTLGVRQTTVHLWRYYIPQLAIEHTFLLHGLLAFAALHLAYLRPERSAKYLQLCDKHQGPALRKYRSILSSSVDPELAEALFALAATLSLLSMARSCGLSDTETMDMVAIKEVFILTKGVANVMNLSREHFDRSPLAALLIDQTYPRDTPVDLPDPVSRRFEAIMYMLDTYGLDLEALKNCHHALTELQETYKSIVHFAPISNIEIGMVSRWQVKVSTGYVSLIEARNPPALVILAYYAAAFTAIRTAWYTQNWAECALRGISQSLEADMQQWIQWPMQQIQEGMSELGVRPALDEVIV